MPPKKDTEKVNRAFDLSKWDNIDISDDESTFHPNIEDTFNIKINRTVRGRRDDEEAIKKEELLKAGTPEALKELDKLERNKKWHVGNICEVVEEKTIVNEYGKSPTKTIEFAPAGASSAELEGYFPWKDKHEQLLQEFVNLGGDLEATHKLLKRDGETLLSQDTSLFSHTYCMLTCLDAMVNYNDKLARKCAQQSQLLSHIIELAKSFRRPTRDLVHQWFSKIEAREEAHAVYQEDVDEFIKKVTGMADEKRERLLKEAEDEAKQQKSGERWVAKQMHQNANFKKVNSDGVVEENVDDIEMESEAQPLVKAMFSMTKVQRLELSPGGLDPLEVFEALPQEMKTAFESQDVPMLARLQQEMPPDIFGFHLNQCMQSGLWQHPGAHDGDSSDKDEEEEEEKEGVPADVVTDV
eukprot:GEMP01018847.1.p1 GENE.GEMP01018847.1~~GEMP01018847.1.p1  ORF type:complete len:411 (+),score=118.72 GEMP01018847.1:59-1291(+)